MDTEYQDQKISTGSFSKFSSIITVNIIPQTVLAIQQLPNIADEIKTEAIQVYYQISQFRPECKLKSVKGKKQLKIIFYCIFNAHINLDCYIDPIGLSYLLKLKKTVINKALSSYTPRGVTIIPPEKCISYYLHRLNELLKEKKLKEYPIEECVDGTIIIIQLCKNSQLGDDWITDVASKTVAIICLYFYLNDIVNEGISKYTELYGRACFVSFAGIRKYYDIVRNLCNSYYETEHSFANYKEVDARTLYVDHFL